MFKVITSLFKFAFKALKKLGGNKEPLQRGTKATRPPGYIYTYDINGMACDKCKPHDRSKVRVNKDGTVKVLKEPFRMPPVHPRCDCIIRSRKI